MIKVKDALLSRLKWHDWYLMLVYGIVIVWVFVGFPRVNVSSGELKPRGLFVDENAINVYHHVDREFVHTPLGHTNRAGVVSCQEMLEHGASSCLEHRMPGAADGGLLQIIVDPEHSPKPLEATLLILQGQEVDLDLVLNLAQPQAGQAKRLVLLVIQEGDPLALLEDWLRQHYELDGDGTAPSAADRAPSPAAPYLGLIRSAFIFQLKHRYSQFQLQYASYVLPNMDMLSYLLLAHGHLVSSQQEPKQRLPGPLNSLLTFLRPDRSMHGLLNRLNIDAVSLQAVTTATGGDTYGSPEAFQLAIDLLHMASSLEEELHHSFFFYFLLDDGHFVGIGEYGLVIGLMMLSLAAMTANHTAKILPKVAQGEAGFASLSVALVLWIALVGFARISLLLNFSQLLAGYLLAFPFAYALYRQISTVY